MREQRERAVQRGRRGIHPHGGAGRGVGPGVGEEVAEHLLDAVGVGADVRQVVGCIARETDRVLLGNVILLPARRPGEIGRGHRAECHGNVAGLQAGDVEEVLHETSHLTDGPMDDFQPLPLLRLQSIAPVEEEGGAGKHEVERVPEVVGDHGHHLIPHPRRPLGGARLPLELERLLPGPEQDLDAGLQLGLLDGRDDELVGRVVDSAETSERFLWDFRRTLADMFADNHYAVMAELAHRARGLLALVQSEVQKTAPNFRTQSRAMSIVASGWNCNP